MEAKDTKPKVNVKGKPHDRRKGAVKGEERKAHIERIAGNMARAYGKRGDSIADMKPKAY
jgi:hypothetical protein